MRDNYKVIPRQKNYLALTLYECICSVLIAFSIFYIIFGSIYEVSVVEGMSMLPTLNNQTINEVYINTKTDKYDYEDIVVIDKSSVVGVSIIKRVVGLPGDNIKIVRNSEGLYHLYRNGVKIEEDYILDTAGMVYTYNQFVNSCLNNIDTEYIIDEVGDKNYVVPSNSIFVLGDNRGNSSDSSVYGAFDMKYVQGKVDYVVDNNTNYYAFVFGRMFGFLN